MLSAFAALCFAGFVLTAVVFARIGHRPYNPARRKFGVSVFLVYAFGASFGAGLTQRDLFPFAAWPLIAAKVSPVASFVRLRAVDAHGVEHDIDHRAWLPLSYAELHTWLYGDFLRLDHAARDRVARYLLEAANTARTRAWRGGAPGARGRFLGQVAAPEFVLYPAIWSTPRAVPPGPFVGLRHYRETWNVEARARSAAAAVRRRLMYVYPPAP